MKEKYVSSPAHYPGPVDNLLYAPLLQLLLPLRLFLHNQLLRAGRTYAGSALGPGGLFVFVDFVWIWRSLIAMVSPFSSE